MSITIEDILAARERIRGHVALTPCVESVPLSELTGCRVFCKLDYLQRTGSFKERGACNALRLLDDASRRRGVIAASAGNHALGLAYHGQRLGIPVTVVMPRFAPLIKVSTSRRLGANVIRHGASFTEARAKADEIAAEQGMTYVHGFDDFPVMAGQGTIGLEVLEQTPDVEAVIVPAGGGGLLAGTAVAVKQSRPSVQVIGVEAAAAPCASAAFNAGKPVAVPCGPTLADGLAVGTYGANALNVAKPYVDRIVQADESAIALSILRLLELEKSVVEGAAATPLAALLGATLADLRGRTVVLLLCGGNIDPAILGRVIDKGLVADGRLVKLMARISDHPGSLAAFGQAVATAGASIRDVQHDRAFNGSDVTAVTITCTLETDGHAHSAEVIAALAPFSPTVLSRAG